MNFINILSVGFGIGPLGSPLFLLSNLSSIPLPRNAFIHSFTHTHGRNVFKCCYLDTVTKLIKIKRFHEYFVCI